MYRGRPVWLDRNDHHCTGGKNIQSQNRPIRRPEGLWIYHWWGLIFIHYQLNINCFIYRKRGKIRWAKLLCFSRFSAVPWNFFHEYKRLSLIILNNEYLCTAYGQGNVKIFPRKLRWCWNSEYLAQQIFPRLRYCFMYKGTLKITLLDCWIN